MQVRILEILWKYQSTELGPALTIIKSKPNPSETYQPEMYRMSETFPKNIPHTFSEKVQTIAVHSLRDEGGR